MKKPCFKDVLICKKTFNEPILLYLHYRVMLHGTISIEKTYGWITL